MKGKREENDRGSLSMPEGDAIRMEEKECNV
jgi:hypothetical protein